MDERPCNHQKRQKKPVLGVNEKMLMLVDVNRYKGGQQKSNIACYQIKPMPFNFLIQFDLLSF